MNSSSQLASSNGLNPDQLGMGQVVKVTYETLTGCTIRECIYLLPPIREKRGPLYVVMVLADPCDSHMLKLGYVGIFCLPIWMSKGGGQYLGNYI